MPVRRARPRRARVGPRDHRVVGGQAHSSTGLNDDDRSHDSFRRAERAEANLTLPAPTPQPTAKLALISSRGYDSYGYHIVEGQVRNISDEARRNVAAVTTWYDGEDGFIPTDDALIDYNPILPGQTSPFTTMSTTNPAMEKYTVAFQRLMGGTIETEDRRKR